MTTYKGIRGLTIRTVAGDIDPVALGDIWYNTIARKIKVGKSTTGAWATGGNLNTARYANSGFGPNTAALTASGLPGFIADSEEYDGSSWTEGSNLNTGRSRSGNNMGTQTAALLAAGRTSGNVANVEEYNGTSWSEVTDIPTATQRSANAGIQTAGLVFGGDQTKTESFEYDGTNWTAGGDLGASSYNMFGFGTQTAAIGAGGYDGQPAQGETWDYNGTAWTDTSADINTARYDGGSAGTSSTAGLIFGGDKAPGVAVEVEQYDGTSWTEVANITENHQLGSSGTYASGLRIGGYQVPAIVSTTDEWTGDHVAAATVTSS